MKQGSVIELSSETVSHAEQGLHARDPGLETLPSRDWIKLFLFLSILSDVGLILWLLLAPADNVTKRMVADISVAAGIVISIGLTGAFVGIRIRELRERGMPVAHLLPSTLLLYGGLLLTLAAEIVAAFDPTTFPSGGDVIMLMAYPSFFFAVVFLPVRSRGLKKPPRLFIEGAIVAATIITFDWLVSLGPAVFRAGESTPAGVVLVCYAVADMVLLATVVLLWAYAHDRFMRSTLLAFGAALLAMTSSDMVTQHRFPALPSPLISDPIALTALLFAGLGVTLMWLNPISQSDDVGRNASDSGVSVGVGSVVAAASTVIPYGAAIVVAGLAVYAWTSHGQSPSHAVLMTGVIIAAAFTVGLIVSHQALTLGESRSTHKRLSAAYKIIERQNRILEELATRDSLTGLLNRRSLDQIMDTEVERSVRYQRPLSVALLDLDDFKHINDSMGHATGDVVLCTASRLIQSELRTADMIGRWGGDEFLIILPETERERAEAALVRVLDQMRTMWPEKMPVTTLSIGLACLSAGAATAGELVELADRAMYRAKSAGGDRISVWEPEPTRPLRPGWRGQRIA